MKSVAAARTACVDLPDFALQLLFQQHPEWRDRPTAVVSKETGRGEVLMVSAPARKRGITPGLCCAAALGLVPELRTAAVSGDRIKNGKAEVMACLQTFSPKVQSAIGDSGTFWVSLSGLEHLYRSVNLWANQVLRALHCIGFQAVVVAGFHRFNTFALARNTRRNPLVLKTPEQEASLVKRVPLKCLDLSPLVYRELLNLGTQTLGDLCDLPAGGLLERYGPSVYRLHRMASGTRKEPLAPEKQQEPLGVSYVLDDPQDNALRLTFLIKRLLGDLVARLARRHELLEALEITLKLLGTDPVVMCVRTARPTREQSQWIDLIRLRIERTVLAAGVTEIHLKATAVKAAAGQRPLFPACPRRSPQAADRALARICAEFGPDAVVRVRIRSGHLPEARFGFEPLTHLPSAKEPGEKHRMCLIRRIFHRPRPIPGRQDIPPDANALSSPIFPDMVLSDICGPYILSGGWWNTEIHREYYFVPIETGAILWVYFDAKRRRWFVHGTVE